MISIRSSRVETRIRGGGERARTRQLIWNSLPAQIEGECAHLPLLYLATLLVELDEPEYIAWRGGVALCCHSCVSYGWQAVLDGGVTIPV